VRIERSEWRFVGLFIVAVLVLTSVPYAFASLTAPPEKQFMGFVLHASDHAQYLTWYRGFQKDFLIPNRLTSEANPPLFFNLLWWTLGRFGRYTGLHYAVVYQIFRWVAGALFLGLVYPFVALSFPDTLRRRLSFLVIALGSGFGWVLVVLKYTLTGGELRYPLDVYIVEGNSFLGVMACPHFIEAAALIVLVFWLLIVGEQRKQLRYAILAGLAAHFLGWQHGYDLLIVWGVPAAYIGARVLRDRRLPTHWVRSLLIVGLLSWPPVLYAVLLTRLNPIWRKVLAQFANAGVFTPAPPHMAILLGLPFLAALITMLAWLWNTARHTGSPDPLTGEAGLFVGAWFLAGWALTYIPADFQVHMLNSWQVPIGILATGGLFQFLKAWRRESRFWKPPHFQTLTAAIFVVLVIPTNLYLFAWRFVDLNRHDYPYYLHQDELAALDWLQNSAQRDDIVLSSLTIGQYIPALTDGKAFLAHWAQTVDFFQKREIVNLYFSDTTLEDQRTGIVRRYDIRYVFYGEPERALGGYDPDSCPYLQKVFSSSNAFLYKVDTESLTSATE